MATKIRGITLSIGGDTSPLAKAFKDLNSTIYKTSGELKDIDKLLKLNPDNTTLLTQKQEALEKQLINVAEKLTTLKEIETELKERREADPSNKNLADQLRVVEREIISTNDEATRLKQTYEKTSAAIDDLGKAVDNSEKKHKTFRDRIHDAVGKLKDFVTGNNSAKTSITDSATEINSKMEIWNKFADTVGNAASKLWNLVKNAASTADEINTLSKTTGMSTESIQKFRYASELVDVSMDTLQDSLKHLTDKMGKARDGNKEAGDSFTKLKVRVTDAHGQLKSSEEVFYDVIDALGKIQNQTERDAVSMSIFGESANRLNPLIASGSEVLREYGYEAESLGLVLSQDTLDGANNFNDALYRLQQTLQGVATSIGAELADSLTVLLEALLPIILAIGNVLSLIASIDPAVLQIIVVTLSMVMVFVKVVSAVSSITGVINTMNPAMWKTVAVIMVIITALIALLAIIAAIAGKKNDIKEIGESISEMNGTVNINGITQAGNNIPRYANGTNYHPGGLAFITEFAPEQLSLPNGTNAVVMPRGTKVSPDISAQSGGDIFNISISAKDVQEFNDIVKIAKRARIERRSK